MERGDKPEAIYNEPGGDDDTKAAKADLDDVDSDPAAARDDQRSAGDGAKRPDGASRCLERVGQRQPQAEERIGERNDDEVAGGQELDLGHVGEQADPGVRERHGKRTNASGHARRKRGPGPRTAGSPGKLACADVGPDQSEDASAEAERQGIEQVFEAYGGSKTRKFRRAKRPDEASEHREREIVERGLQRHRRADPQDFNEKPAPQPYATQCEPDSGPSRDKVPSQFNARHGERRERGYAGTGDAGGSGPTPNISVGTSRMCRTWDAR